MKAHPGNPGHPVKIPWPTVSLGELLRLERRRVKVEPEELYQEIGIYCFGRGIFHKTPRTGFEVGDKDLFLMKEGDFILQVTFAWEGAIAIVSAEEDGMYGSTRYPTFRVDESRCIPQFLLNYFRTEGGLQQLVKICPGSAGRNRVLSIKRIPEVLVPLPPLAEQRRVVARIEALAAQIHEARTLRHQAVEEAEALTGASASQLFQECSERQPIMALAEVRGGIQKGPHRAPGANPVRYLTVAHVHRNRILTDSPRYFEVSPDELERWRLLRGDVLIIEGNGSADQIGRTALFRGEIENCVHQNHVIRIRPDKRRVLPEFLNTFLNSPAGQEAVQGQSRTSSGLRSLSVGRIKSICVPVPPLSEQRRIVSELDALQAQVDALKRLQAETAAELDALLPSILDKAFKGQL